MGDLAFVYVVLVVVDHGILICSLLRLFTFHFTFPCSFVALRCCWTFIFHFAFCCLFTFVVDVPRLIFSRAFRCVVYVVRCSRFHVCVCCVRFACVVCV